MRTVALVVSAALSLSLSLSLAVLPVGAVEARAVDTTAPVIDSVTCDCPGGAYTYSGILFTATARDEESGIASTTWAFSDGGSGTGTTVPHTTTEAGPLTATVTVTDGAGNASTASTTVDVRDNLLGGYPTYSEPVVDRVRLRPGTLSVAGASPGVPRRARLGFRLVDLYDTTSVMVVVRPQRGGRSARRVVEDVREGARHLWLGERFGGTRLLPGRYRVVVRATNRFGSDESRRLDLRVVR